MKIKTNGMEAYTNDGVSIELTKSDRLSLTYINEAGQLQTVDVVVRGDGLMRLEYPRGETPFTQSYQANARRK